jgi:hypothetical protein
MANPLVVMAIERALILVVVSTDEVLRDQGGRRAARADDPRGSRMINVELFLLLVGLAVTIGAFRSLWPPRRLSLRVAPAGR